MTITKPDKLPVVNVIFAGGPLNGSEVWVAFDKFPVTEAGPFTVEFTPPFGELMKIQYNCPYKPEPGDTLVVKFIPPE